MSCEDLDDRRVPATWLRRRGRSPWGLVATCWFSGCMILALTSPAAESELEIIPIEGITQEIHPVALQVGVVDARIHNIRIGQVVRLHTHPFRPELVAVLKGTARVRGLRLSEKTGEPILREEIVETGNLVFSPATALHEFSNVGLEPLWCLVLLSPPFDQNHYLGLAPLESALDFLVLSIDSDEAARGGYLPDWAKQLAREGSGEVDYFPNIPAELIKSRVPIEAKSGDPESWLVLLQGSGILSHSGGDVAVSAPTLIRGVGENWSLLGDVPSEEVVALRFRLPSN